MASSWISWIVAGRIGGFRVVGLGGFRVFGGLLFQDLGLQGLRVLGFMAFKGRPEFRTKGRRLLNSADPKVRFANARNFLDPTLAGYEGFNRRQLREFVCSSPTGFWFWGCGALQRVPKPQILNPKTLNRLTLNPNP